ncbi:MAG: autotransporter-associated beta strand repeat-containing protein, partial [Phycisphaerae bacterium]
MHMKSESAVSKMAAVVGKSVRGMKKRRLSACYLTLAAALAGSAANAATLTWDPGQTPATPSGGAGTWDLATTNWSTGSVDQAWADVSATGTDTAIFGGTAGAVTLNTNVSAAGLVFNTTGYTMSGTGVLTLGSGGIDASTLTSGNVTMSNAVKLVANQTWNAGAGATVTTGALSGTGGLTKSGDGTVKVAGGTITGLLNVSAGTLQVTQDFHANGGLTGAGTILDPTTADKWFFVSEAAGVNDTFSGQILGGASKLGLNKSGNGTLTLTGANQIDDAVTVVAGTLIFSGNHNNTTQTDNIGTTANLNAVLVLPAGVNFNSNFPNGTQPYNSTVSIGTNGTAAGSVQNNGATFNVNHQLGVGTSGYGAYTQTAGNTTIGGFLAVGNNVNGGVVNISGGNFTLVSGDTGAITLGFGGVNSGTYGVMNLSGSANVTVNSTTNNGIFIGEVNNGILNMSGNAVLTINSGGTPGTGGGVLFTKNAAGNAILNADGGTVVTPFLSKGSGTGTFNFNGGTLKANADATAFMSGLTNAYVYSGGGTIDDGGFNITIGQALLAPTGSGVSNVGLTVSGTGFIDTPVITVTGGGGTGATAVASIDSNGNLTGITITNPGTGYTSAPTFNILGGGRGNTGSITGSAALVANVGGGLTKQGTGTTTLTGASTYTGATNVTAGTLVVDVSGSINGSSGITVNGGKFVANSNVSPAITLTSGALDGTGSVGNVTVANSANTTINNGFGTAGPLTIGNLQFNGTSNMNLTISSTSPAITASGITTSGGGGVSTGKVTINVNNLGVWTTGTYDLVQYGGSLGGVGFSDFQKGLIAGLGARQTANLTNLPGFIGLTITGDAPKWTGAQNGNWTTAVIPGSKNWQLISSGTPTDYITGDTVLFDDSATGTTNVTISDANVSPTSVTFANSGKAYSISGPFGIAGTSNVTINGGGTVALGAPSTYSGGTNLVNGVLAINGASGIGTGALNITGGSLDNTSGAPVTLTTVNTINLSTDLTFNGSNDLNLGTGALALTGARTFNMNGTANLTIGGNITGNFGITVQGTGNLVLTGTNTNVGSTIIHSGTLTIAGGTTGILSTAATSDIQISPGGSDTGTLQVTGGVLNANRVIIGGDSGNTAGGFGKLVQTGGTINSQQWFTVGSGNAAGATFGSGEYDLSGGTLNQMSQQIEVANFFGTTGTVNMSGGNINLFNNTLISFGANGLASDGTFNQSGGNVTFYSNTTAVGGTGLISLGRNASASGIYTYNLNGGTLTVPQITKTASTSNTAIFNFNGGTLKAAVATSTWIHDIDQANVQAGGAIIDDGGFAVTIPQNLSSGGGTDGGLTKLGTGTLTLTGTDSYTGPTTVNAGTLVVANGTLSSTSSVVVNAASKMVLSGTASLNGSATVNVNGGTFVQASSNAVGGTVTVTAGLLSGSNATVNTVVVPNGGGAVGNGNNDTGVLTIGSLTFNGTGAIDPVLSGPTATNSPGIVVTSLTTGGTAGQITVNPMNASWNPGVYDLVSYNSLSGLGFNAFTLGTVGGLSPRQHANLTNVSGEIALTISAGDVVVWTGAASSDWTTATIPTPKNWKLQSSGTATDFINGDLIQFDDTATGSTNVNISDANVNVTSMTFANSSKNYTISSTGGFGIGGGYLVKSGTGTVTLNTANSYSGGTTLTAGVLNLNTPTAIGTGVLTLNGGTLGNSSGANVTLTTNNLVSLNADSGFSGPNNLSLGTGVVTIGGTPGDRTLTANNGTLSMGPVFGAAGYGLVIAGNGTVAIQTPDTSNVAAEQSTVAGELTVQTGATFSTGAADTFFGGLQGGGTITNLSNVTRWMTVGMDNSNTTFSGSIMDGSAGLGLRKRGTGTLTLSGTNSYTSTTTVESGGLVITGSNSLPGNLVVGTATTTATVYMKPGSSDAGGFVQIGGGNSVSGAFVMTGGTLSTGTSEFWLATADGGYGYMNMSGGSVTVGNWMALGRGGGQGVMDVSGNATLSITANNLTIGSFGGSTTDIHGVVTVSGNANVSSAGAIYVGENTPGVMTVMGNATVSAAGGDGVMFSKNSATTGILNLNGGTTSTTKLTMNLAGTSTANFNGGTLKALGNSTNFISNLTNAIVYSGGITLDDGGFNVTVPQVLQAPTASGISAAGLTVSGTGFIGEPVVTVSGGDGSGATAVANIDANGNLTGITVTNPGTGYTTAPSFSIMGGGLGSTGSISGTATLVPNVGGGLTKQGTGTVTLSAANTYTGGTTVNGGTLVISGSIVSPSVTTGIGGTLTIATGGNMPSTAAVTNNGTVNFNNPTRTIASLNGTAPGAVVNLNATSLTVSGGGTYAGAINDSGTNGALTVAAALSVGSFNVATVNANANLKIHGTSKTSALNLTGGSGAWTSGLDLTTSKFILQSSVSNKTADMTRVRDQVTFGK